MSAAPTAAPPEDLRGRTTAAVLKYAAIGTMFCDHFAVVFGAKLYPALPFLNAGGFELLRVIGRIAFPVFTFMIAKGAIYTKNIYKYLLRLLVFAFISEVPFDLALFGTPPRELLSKEAFMHQNVFFTLFLGLLCICVYQKLREHRLEALGVPFTLFAAYAAEDLLNTDYGATGVLCIFLYWVFLQGTFRKGSRAVRNTGIVLVTLLLIVSFTFHPYLKQALTVGGRRVSLYGMDVYARVNHLEICGLLSLPLLLTYNGKKGRQLNRWFFYAFYPAHLLLLWGAYTLLFG